MAKSRNFQLIKTKTISFYFINYSFIYPHTKNQSLLRSGRGLFPCRSRNFSSYCRAISVTSASMQPSLPSSNQFSSLAMDNAGSNAVSAHRSIRSFVLHHGLQCLEDIDWAKKLYFWAKSSIINYFYSNPKKLLVSGWSQAGRLKCRSDHWNASWLAESW